MQFKFIWFMGFIFVPYLSLQSCLEIQHCQFPHEYDPKVIAEVDNDNSEATDDYLYDLSLLQKLSANINPQDINNAIGIQMQKATRYFELKKFEKCLEHLKIVEKQQHFYNINTIDKAKILAYKAYCKMYLKKYESATEYFEDLINYLTTTEHYKPCLFASYFYHAFCICALGNEKKSKEKIEKLVQMNLINKNLPSLTIYDQPCFHPNGISETHLIKMSQDIAEATGHNILAVNNQFYPNIALCNNTNEREEECSEQCTYLAGVGAYAAAYIPNKHIQAAVLFSLVLFQVQCTKCCKDGLGSANCLKTLKTILKYTLNQEALEGL